MQPTPPPSRVNSTAIVAFVLAIVCLLLAFVPCLGVFAIFFGILAIVLSVVGISKATKTETSNALPIVALVIGIMGSVVSLSQGALVGYIFQNNGENIEKLLEGDWKVFEDFNLDNLKRDLDDFKEELEEEFAGASVIIRIESDSISEELILELEKAGEELTGESADIVDQITDELDKIANEQDEKNSQVEIRLYHPGLDSHETEEIAQLLRNNLGKATYIRITSNVDEQDRSEKKFNIRIKKMIIESHKE